MLGTTWFVRRSVCVAMVFAIAISSASGLFAEDPATEIPGTVTVAFKKADRDGDRTLSLEEFVAGRGAVEVSKRDFQLYDFSGLESGLQISFLALRSIPDSHLTPPFQTTLHSIREAKNEI